MEFYDHVIIGAGIIGLSIAKELREKKPDESILVLEKESNVGFHASGRNSGVLHSGVYYAKDSVKALVCAEGSRLMAAFCKQQNVPYLRIGKLILPVTEQDNETLDLLYRRGKANQARIEIVDSKQITELEPSANHMCGKGLFLPDVGVVNPTSVLLKLVEILKVRGVAFIFGVSLRAVDSDNSRIKVGTTDYRYGHLYNATGQYSERIAQRFGVGNNYALIPFKGNYYKLANQNIRINRLIYPVPDLNMPFLGVHSVKTIDGFVYFGPSAIPALGRENYKGLQGFKILEASKIAAHLLSMYWHNRQNFRRYAKMEATRFLKANFLDAVQALVPAVSQHDLTPSDKVGIRAQLFDKEKGELVNDFIVERKENTTHVLNAVSPAFTCAFSLAKKIVAD